MEMWLTSSESNTLGKTLKTKSYTNHVKVEGFNKIKKIQYYETARAYHIFRSTERQGVFLPLLDEIPVHCKPPPPPPLTCALQHFTDSLPAPIYTTKGGERGEENEWHTLGVKCFSKEHNRMTWPRLEPTPFDPESAPLVTGPPLLPQSPW